MKCYLAAQARRSFLCRRFHNQGNRHTIRYKTQYPIESFLNYKYPDSLSPKRDCSLERVKRQHECYVVLNPDTNLRPCLVRGGDARAVDICSFFVAERCLLCTVRFQSEDSWVGRVARLFVSSIAAFEAGSASYVMTAFAVPLAVKRQIAPLFISFENSACSRRKPGMSRHPISTLSI